MGAKLSKQPSSELIRQSSSKQQPKAGNSNDHSASQGSSFIDLIKPECLKAKKTMKKKKQTLQPPEKVTTEVRNETLQDWLLASPGPGLRPDCLSGGELYVFKQFSKRVHPSATKSHPDMCSTPKTSFSSDVPSVNGSSILSRGQSGKLKKKVSFKLPEEADIIIFYSPEKPLGSDQEIQDSL